MKKEIQWILKEKYNNKPTKELEGDLKRLSRGEPLDYIIGFKEFLGCKIDLSKKPLIPRTETEFWVKQAIEYILIFCRISEFNKKKEVNNNSTHLDLSRQNLRILDIFSGSGCIGISIMRHINEMDVDFADSEENTLKQIKINLKINFKDYSLIRENKRIVRKGDKGDINRRVRVIKSDIFSNIKSEYDYIFANPPYIPTKNKSKAERSVLKHEPKRALFGGVDGLFYIRKFLKDAKKFLKPSGVIFMEFDSSPLAKGERVDPPQKKEIEKLLKLYRYKSWEFKKDQYKKWRWVVIS